MKYYKIIALTCSGRGKRIHKAGDIAPESQFEPKAISDLIDRKFIEIASKEDISEWKKRGNKTEEEKIAVAKKESKQAESEAKAKLDEVKKEYMELTGSDEQELNKTWGVTKFTKEIKLFLTQKYNELAGDDKQDVTSLSNQELREKISELESQN